MEQEPESTEERRGRGRAQGTSRFREHHRQRRLEQPVGGDRVAPDESIRTGKNVPVVHSTYSASAAMSASAAAARRRAPRHDGRAPPGAWPCCAGRRRRGGAPAARGGRARRRDRMRLVAERRARTAGGAEGEQKTATPDITRNPDGKERANERRNRAAAHGSTLLVPNASRVSMTKRCPTNRARRARRPPAAQEDIRSATDGSRIAARTSARDRSPRLRAGVCLPSRRRTAPPPRARNERNQPLRRVERGDPGGGEQRGPARRHRVVARAVRGQAAPAGAPRECRRTRRRTTRRTGRIPATGSGRRRRPGRAAARADGRPDRTLPRRTRVVHPAHRALPGMRITCASAPAMAAPQNTTARPRAEGERIDRPRAAVRSGFCPTRRRPMTRGARRAAPGAGLGELPVGRRAQPRKGACACPLASPLRLRKPAPARRRDRNRGTPKPTCRRAPRLRPLEAREDTPEEQSRESDGARRQPPHAEAASLAAARLSRGSRSSVGGRTSTSVTAPPVRRRRVPAAHRASELLLQGRAQGVHLLAVPDHAEALSVQEARSSDGRREPRSRIPLIEAVEVADLARAAAPQRSRDWRPLWGPKQRPY